MALFLFASSKKSISALQLQRQLPLGSYRTAWFMAHRIRHAMANGGMFAKLEGIVEADEMYVGGKPRRHAGAPKGKRTTGAGRGRSTEKKTPVQVLVQRDGGGARARATMRVDGATLQPFIREHVAKSAAIHSDEWGGYTGLAKHFDGGHHVVRHGQGEYARGAVHSNSAESFNGLFKRAINGAWHHVSREHIGRYLDEACFRWSHRKEHDSDRTLRALRQTDGVRLYYRKPRRPPADAGSSLVSDR